MILLIFANISSIILEFWNCEEIIEYVFLSISIILDIILIGLTQKNQQQYLNRLLLLAQASLIFSIFKTPKLLAITAIYQYIMRQLIHSSNAMFNYLEFSTFFIVIAVLSTNIELFDIIRTSIAALFFIGYQVQIFQRENLKKTFVNQQTEQQIPIKMEIQQIVDCQQQTQKQSLNPEIILNDFLEVIESNKMMDDILSQLNYNDPNKFLQEIRIIHIDSVSEKKLGKWREECLLNLLKRIINKRSEILVQILDYNHSSFQKYLILIHYKNQFNIQFFQVNERDTYIKKRYLSEILYQLFKTFSHEFGTLLNYLLALSQVAIDQFPNQVDFFEPIKSTGQIMHHFVQDMVDYSDILNKKFQLQFALVDVESLLQEVIGFYQKQIEEKGLSITYQILLDDKSKFFDGRRCKQVLSNLIANAQKFTVSGSIKIIVTEQSGFTVFSVEDTGFGMNDETFNNLNQTLENEFKSEQKISQNTAGFGLGCYLSHQIALKLSNLSIFAGGGLKYVRLEKGIRVSFRVKNQPFEIFYTSCDISSAKSGILFNENGYFDSRQSVIDLQMTNRHKSIDNHVLLTMTRKSGLLSASFSPHQVLEYVDQELKQENEILDRVRQFNNLKKRDNQKKSPTFGASVADIAGVETIREQPHLLIVDDEMINIISLKILLNQFNINCTSAFNGLEALQKVKEFHGRFDVIFMDVNMPIMDGFQATEQIMKFNDENIIVACTAFTDVETKTKCYSVGMNYKIRAIKIIESLEFNYIMIKHKKYAIIGMYILQIIYATLECSRAPVLNLILLLISLAINLIQLVLLIKQGNLNIFTQFAINILSVFARQNDQFMVLQSLVGFILYLQNDQKRWHLNILASSIHVTLICIYSQNNEVQSYLMSVFTILFVTYYSWAINHQKQLKQLKQSNQTSLLTSRVPNAIKSLVFLEDIHSITLKSIVLENSQTLDVRSFTTELKQILIRDQVSEENFLDHMKVLKVDKQTQRNLNQKIKGISLRQLITKCQILQKTTDILIIKTNFIQLEYYQIKLHFERDLIILNFEEIKEITKYIKKNSCFALMNKLFQSFSHEFGTLLNQIALIAQNGLAQSPNMKDQLDSIYNCVLIMNNMVKDLKDFHQLRSKTFQLEIADMNIDDVFAELQNLFKQQAMQKQIQLFLVNKVTITFKQDEQRIKQILQNLIQNAIKYTNQDGNIYVTAEIEDERRIKFQVLDSGIGISENVASNIQQMLGNDLILTSKLSEGAAGLGLGLLNSNYLIKHISSFKQANKEHLQFKSKIGDGTKFWFYIWKYHVLESPSSQFESKSIKMIDKKVFLYQKSNLAPPLSSIISNSKSCPSQIKRLSPNRSQQTRPQPQIFFPSSIKDENIIMMEEDDRTIAEDPKPNHLPGQRARYPSMSSPECQYVKLLLVDDEPANLFPLKTMIKMLGFEADTAQNGYQAIQYVESRLNQRCQYHLILMDINMPQIDGFETTKKIKNLQPEITIIPCSAFSDMQTKYQAQIYGMVNYLEKPINKENLKQILESYL